MSEMLGNHYFLVRNFVSAKTIFENIISKDSTNKLATKKLIVCYVTTGEIEKAWDLFVDVVKQDAEIITATKTDSEDCPCSEIITNIENKEIVFDAESKRIKALIILWLYCSLEISIKFLKQLESQNPNDLQIKEINSILINKLIRTNNKSIN